MLKESVGKTAFFGKNAPSCFMTDNDDAIKNALKTVWPQSQQFLCHFHILQQVCLNYALHSFVVPINIILISLCKHPLEYEFVCFPTKVWRWLLDQKHGISANDRQTLMATAKTLVYSTTKKMSDDTWESFLSSSIAKKYPQYQR